MIKQARAVTFFNVDIGGHRTREGSLNRLLEDGYTVVSSHVVDDWIEYIVQKEIKDE